MAFNQETAGRVCSELEQGKSLRAACKEVGISASAILDWVKINKDFGEQYAHARDTGYKLLADEIIDISDEKEVQARYQGEDVTLDLSAASIARNKLRIDARKWMLSKMLPKIYGDKLELSGNKENPVEIVGRIELVPMTGKKSA